MLAPWRQWPQMLVHIKPLHAKTSASSRSQIYTIGWEYVKTYLALVKWAGQMFAIAVYDAAERPCHVLS